MRPQFCYLLTVTGGLAAGLAEHGHAMSCKPNPRVAIATKSNVFIRTSFLLRVNKYLYNSHSNMRGSKKSTVSYFIFHLN